MGYWWQVAPGLVSSLGLSTERAAFLHGFQVVSVNRIIPMIYALNSGFRLKFRMPTHLLPS